MSQPKSFTSLPLELQQRIVNDLDFPPMWPWVAAPHRSASVRKTLIRVSEVSKQLHKLASPLIGRMIHIDGDKDHRFARRFVRECIRRPSLGADVQSIVWSKIDQPQAYHRLILIHIHRFPNVKRLLGLPLSPGLFDDLLIPPPLVRPQLHHLTVHQSNEHLDDPTVITQWLDLSALRILTVKGEAEIPLDVSCLTSGGHIHDITLMSVFVKRPFAPLLATLRTARHVDLEFTNLELEDVQPLLYAAPNLRNLVLPAWHPVSSLARLSHRKLEALALPASVTVKDAVDFASKFARKRMPLLVELSFADLDLNEDQALEVEDGESAQKETITTVLREVGINVDWLAQ